ncbi:hypothetical protein ACOTVZ_11980 [Aliarcobacter butzleri]
MEKNKIISHEINEVELMLKLLIKQYGYNLSKSELSNVLRISEQTINRRIKDNSNIPEYKRSGNGTKSLYLFSALSVASYIVNNNIKIY